MVISIGFCALPNSTEDAAYADITGVSGNNFVLTGYNGYQPDHYFYDIANNSTLNAVDVTTCIKNYMNASGEECNKFYVITANNNTSFTNKKSYGTAYYYPTTDMSEFVDKEVLYARVSAGVLSFNDKGKSKVKLTISHNRQTYSVTSSKVSDNNESVYSPEYIYTDFVKITDITQPIVFTFEGLDSGSMFSSSKFTIFEPTISLKTCIDEVTIENEGKTVTVFPGQIVELGAVNDITTTTGTNNFAKYCRNIHRISYVIAEGKEYASIIGKYLYVKSNIPNNATIKVAAKCRNDSLSSNYIYSEIATYSVNAETLKVNILTDFDNPGTVTGGGNYYTGQTVSLIAEAASGYTFVGWKKGSELLSSSKNYTFTVTEPVEIKAWFIKTVIITGISVTDKVYDGTNNVEGLEFVFDGKREGHELTLDNIEVKYSNINVGDSIVLETSGVPTLGGRNADIYRVNQYSIPTSFGKILPRQINVTSIASSKVYGDSQEELPFEITPVEGNAESGLVEGESLSGTLGRDLGENVGNYNTNTGTLTQNNTNYELLFTSSVFVINRRNVTISSIVAQDKVYDATSNVQISIILNNTIAGDDIQCVANGQFNDVNVGYNIVVPISSKELVGSAKDNYTLVSDIVEITGNILPKVIKVVAENKTVTYGERVPLSYLIEGIVEGESLNGELTREDNDNVGSYAITMGSLSNPNYTLDFTAGSYVVNKKPITVVADSITKSYGDADPTLTYQVTGLVNEDVLSGVLYRTVGETCGDYPISIGTIHNDNYDIAYTPSILSITKREVELDIYMVDKIYDGNAVATFTYEFVNLASGDALTFEAQMYFVDENMQMNANAGVNKKILVTSSKISGEMLSNYSVTGRITNLTATISRRAVYIDIDKYSKIYGDEDPIIGYEHSNIIEGDALVGTPKRNVGENCGEYSIYLNDLNNENNPNYNIVYKTEGSLTIVQRQITIKVDNATKYYGDTDPEPKLSIASGSVANGLELEDILSGAVNRVDKETVGRHQYLQGSLAIDNNYNMTFDNSDSFLLIQKRNITVIADSLSKIYGEADEALTYEVTNLVDGDTFNFELQRIYGEDVGEYSIEYVTLNDSRYNIEFVAGVYHILPRDITIQADKKVKIYGDNDPIFTCSIVDGILANNDSIYTIQIGSMHRQSGEDVGAYMIEQGDYSFGKNYNIEYQTNELTIESQKITVVAREQAKYYYDEDPILDYSIASGELKLDDEFVGQLQRTEGENVGEYNINIGSLAINNNYIITFVPAVMTIGKRPITIVADPISKTYGEEDPTLTYRVIGEIKDGDVLSGELQRAKPTSLTNPTLYENVGKYDIVSTFSNESYDITYVENIFTINQRIVTIVADSFTITYGEEDPVLTYKIVSGEILDGDVISGELYRVPGTDAGKYDIRSSITLGKNYKIVFTKGTLNILPIDIVVECKNYEKIYGSVDPMFEYEIIEGALINDDELSGGITREAGKAVGKYKLLSSLSNINYSISIKEAYLTIVPKQAYLNCAVHDKVYNGDTIAYIKTPVVTGLIDNDIELIYDKENSANFVSSTIGFNILVVFHDISLVGDGAENYTLVLPEGVTGNITNNEITSEGVSITTYTNTTLVSGVELKTTKMSVSASQMGITNKQVVSSYDVWMENSGELVELDGSITLEIKLPNKFKRRNNLYVYKDNEDGTYSLVNSTVKNGYVSINTDKLGTYIVVSDNEKWIDVGAYISLAVLALVGLYVLYKVLKKKKSKKKEI